MRSMQVAIGLLVQDWKSVFIHQYASRFAGDHESRTVVPHMLSQMLRMPLSLGGTWGKVLYPSYAGESFPNADNDLKFENVLKRFFDGGGVVHRNGAFSHTHEWGGLSLKVLGQAVRDCIYDPESW